MWGSVTWGERLLSVRIGAASGWPAASRGEPASRGGTVSALPTPGSCTGPPSSRTPTSGSSVLYGPAQPPELPARVRVQGGGGDLSPRHPRAATTSSRTPQSPRASRRSGAGGGRRGVGDTRKKAGNTGRRTGAQWKFRWKFRLCFTDDGKFLGGQSPAPAPSRCVTPLGAPNPPWPERWALNLPPPLHPSCWTQPRLRAPPGEGLGD